MDVIRASLHRPMVVLALVVSVVLFGIVGVITIPIQLTPDVRRPVITVRTAWGGAAPADVEREILSRQEEVLKGVSGLQSMESSARRGSASISLEFAIGTDMDRAMLLVSNRLNRVSGYPEEVDEPTLDTAGSEDTPIASLLLERTPGNTRPTHTYGDFADTVVAERLERIPGVASTRIHGGSERELQVIVDPARLAAYRLTVSDVVNALRAADVAASAGFVNDGKRRYLVRVDGNLISPERVAAVLLRSERDAAGNRTARVTVGDVGDVAFGYKRPSMVLRSLGDPALSISVLAETGTNVMATMERVRAAVDELNAEVLPREGLHMRMVYDQTDYVSRAIDLVVQNIYVGGILAALVLFVFLRSLRATLVISLAIPISTIGTFVGMNLLGRTLNVISLAGLSFAVGMVVDAAIVVLENIYSHREKGLSRARAAEIGARQVWGAVLVSSLTTIVVFVPLLLMKQETGQLFRDIAVAIAVSISLSMVVAITVVPVLARRLLGPRAQERPPLALPLLDRFGHAFAACLDRALARITADRRSALFAVGGITAACLALSVPLVPKLEYLPEGNRNMAFGSVRPPPGYNLATTLSIAERIEKTVRPLWARDTGRESPPGTPPKIDNFSFNAYDSGYIEVTATAVDPSRVTELIPLMRAPIFDEPGTYGFMTQPSLFSRSSSGARAIAVDVTGNQLEDVAAVARRLAAEIETVFPRRAGNQLQPRPGLELGAPEVRLTPDPVRLRDAGVSASEFARSIDVFNDGMRVVEINVDNQRVDLTLKGKDDALGSTQDIAKLPVVTADGTVVRAASLADVEVTEGPTEIRHLDGRRAITLQLRPPNSTALQDAIERLRNEVIAPTLRGGLPDGVRVDVSGVASRLAATWSELLWQLLIATAVVYLIMAALFENMLYPLIIMVTLPMASAGALACLGLLNLFVYTPLDMLTMLGFVILIGIVVNNAILLVHQSLFLQRTEGLPMRQAVIVATRSRIRPIFMSTLTSLFGMAPLVLFPGAGTELYRGLGAVVLGGLALSTFLTLLVIPALMCLTAPRTPATDGGKLA